jgi:urease accessory protein
VIARTQIVVSPGGIVRRLDCAPPLTVRQVRSDCAGTAALCLVNSAAGPLGDDDLELSLEVERGARMTLTAAGASLAQGGTSRYATNVRVGAGGSLSARLGPLIVCASAHIDISLTIELAPEAALVWREIVVLGRSGQRAGAGRLRWNVTRAGRPVLRQQVDLGPESWPGVRSGRRVLASAFVTDPALDARTIARSPTAVAARLDEHTLLATVLADDTATAHAELNTLISPLD